MKDKKLWIPILIGVIIILGSFIICFYKQDISDNISDWASFGAYVGGCFGFISVIIMYMVFREQSRMAYKSQFESVFFDMLRTLREIWNNGVEGKSIQLSKEVSMHFNIEYGSEEVSMEDVKKVMTYYMSIHKKDNSINHYFRYLYHIVKYVVTNKNLDKDVKSDYISLIQAQMSNTELLITFFNAIEYDNKKYNNWLDSYGLFENMVTGYQFLDVLKQMYFPLTKFKHIVSVYIDPLEAIQQWYDESHVDVENEVFYDTLDRLNNREKQPREDI